MRRWIRRVKLVRRLKVALHPWLDPALSLPDHWRAQRRLFSLPDGLYCVWDSVPYYAQFASPDRIYDYIHHDFDGVHDPQWATFGAADPQQYAFWAPRSCALACLKMAAQTFDPHCQPTLWEFVQAGLAAGGYIVRDEAGRWIDEGWYFPALIRLGRQYGVRVTGRAYASPLSVCTALLEGGLVAPTVTPELGERYPISGRYGGHLVLVYGFEWRAGQPVAFWLHNPSGRFIDLQAGARIPAEAFAASFAHRLMIFHPVPRDNGQSPEPE